MNTNTINTEDNMIDELKLFCYMHALPLESADELACREDIDNNTWHWLLDYIERWELLFTSGEGPY